MKNVIVLISLLLSITGYSQAKLGMGYQYVITPSAATSPSLGVAYNDTIKINCYVRNKGNATFNGNIDVMRCVKSGTFQSASAIMLSVSISINAGDSIAVGVKDSVNINNYKQTGNGNTVVVWPVSSAAITLDSLVTAPVFVNNQTGIKELDKHALFIYPNPASQVLYVKAEANVVYKEITIYNTELKEAMVMPFRECVTINTLLNGTYFIVITDDKGMRYSSRFTKTD